MNIKILKNVFVVVCFILSLLTLLFAFSLKSQLDECRSRERYRLHMISEIIRKTLEEYPNEDIYNSKKDKALRRLHAEICASATGDHEKEE